MKLRDNLGVRLTDGIDCALREIMNECKVSRADARKLLGDALVRSCVLVEVIEMCKWQMENPN